MGFPGRWNIAAAGIAWGFLSQSAWAAGYIHDAFVCDVGIRNPDRTNRLGVDSVGFTRAGRTQSVAGTPEGVSAVLSAIEKYDRWDSANALTEVAVNLGSDFFGSEYFVEFCYRWDRMAPVDATDYTIDLSLLLNAVPQHVNVNADTNCLLQNKNGSTVNRRVPGAERVQIAVGADFVNLRCGIRFTFTEVKDGSRRPHQISTTGLESEPQIKVKVEP